MRISVAVPPLAQTRPAGMINPFHKQNVSVITDPGKPSMKIMIKTGEKAGAACKMKDGSVVYVPEGEAP